MPHTGNPTPSEMLVLLKLTSLWRSFADKSVAWASFTQTPNSYDYEWQTAMSHQLHNIISGKQSVWVTGCNWFQHQTPHIKVHRHACTLTQLQNNGTTYLAEGHKPLHGIGYRSTLCHFFLLEISVSFNIKCFRHCPLMGNTLSLRNSLIQFVSWYPPSLCILLVCH